MSPFPSNLLVLALVAQALLCFFPLIERRPLRMRTKRLLLLATSALALSVGAQPPAPKNFDGKTWWDHVKVLADDSMEGRETGGKGLRKAEAYVVEQLKEDGLQPAGTRSFYQSVKFVSRQIVEKDSSVTLVRNGVDEPLTLGEDTFFNTRVDLAPEVQAPLVFVGYGLTVPEQKYDDLAGLDLRGKVAVVFSG